MLRAQLAPDDGFGCGPPRQTCPGLCRHRRSRSDSSASLRACGIDVAAERASPTIIRFRNATSQTLQTAAERDGLTLVTTEKDLARLRNNENLAAFAQTVVALRGHACLGR